MSNNKDTMVKNLVALLILAIWLAFGAWYYTCKVRNLCGSKIETSINAPEISSDALTPTKLKLAYRNIFSMEDGIAFEFSEEQVLVDSIFEEGINSISSFLAENPSTSVIITGLYTSDEVNSTKETNLGKARAIAIKNILEEKGISGEQIITNDAVEEDLYLDNKVKQIFNFKFSKQNTTFDESELRAAYQAIDYLERNAQFFKGGEEVLFIQEPKESIKTLEYYLNKNRNYFLQLTGPYMEGEEAPSRIDNIGLVRAYHLKSQLSNYSLNPEKVLIDSRIEENIFDDLDYSFPKMMEMNFVFPDKEDESNQRELALEYALANLLTIETEEEGSSEIDTDTPERTASDTPLSFGYASHNVRMNKKVKDYVKDLQNYLSDYPEKTVKIIGHTDNIGSEEYNFELGRIRGLSARNLLINYKIPHKRIKVVSEGEGSPIADNESSEGRRMNRRVEIDIE